ncbi:MULTISPECIES: hypothetical protein [Serratia]|uniref:hypothetical protein n=1 Tax=Serratia TaxID=613 RepID=UPI0006604E10|nr:MULTISPECIES: hypothetical protein [Serratia]ASM31326.1 hypothetical protein BVG84_10030 [Serratia marcescens]MBH3014695.1 hypothetical protein [Serratia marcescens]QLJ60927.1 hypothetical protein HP475_13815 [Serratia marcescens]QLJ60974.1 hypothetical protein HP475_14090 [Serratia marcescens]CAI2047985.1 Uncharacterised protein [Serratia marcescens]
MAIDITVKVESIGSIVKTGFRSDLEVELYCAELTEAIDAKTIIGEYDKEELLEAIGEDYVQKWLEEQGFTVSYGDDL